MIIPVHPWIFIAVGIVLVAIGTASMILGQQMLSSPPAPAARTEAPTAVLTPTQEGVLQAIYKYQVKFGANKLVILRDGKLFFDAAALKDVNVNIAAEVFAPGVEPAARTREFELVVMSLPTEYLRHLPETRLDNPFVVAITEAGIRYVRSRREN